MPSPTATDRGPSRKPLDLELQRVRRELASAAPVAASPVAAATAAASTVAAALRVASAAVDAKAEPRWRVSRPVARSLLIAAGLTAAGCLFLGFVPRTHAARPGPVVALPFPAAVSCAPSALPSQSDEDFPRTPLDPLKPVPERFTVEVVNTGKTVDVRLAGIAGEPDEESYRALRHELRSSNGAESPLDPRLIEILHQIAKKAGGRVQVLSAFRPPKNSHDHNYHTRGMAADVRATGMGTAALRDLARKLGASGVGYYPTSHFVHVDVRDGHYEWTDTSGPGQNVDDIPASDTVHAAPASSAAPNAAPTLEQALLAADAGPPAERIARAAPQVVDPSRAGQQEQQTAPPAAE